MATIKLGVRMCIAFAVVVALMVLQSYLRESEEATQPLTCHAHRCT